MLTWSFVVERIKDEMGLPFQPLEFTDEQVIGYLKRNALKKFEKYFPAVRRITLDTSVSEIHVPNRNSEYYIIKIDERQVKNSLYSMRSDFMNAVASVLPDFKIEDKSIYDKWYNYFLNLKIR